MRREWGPWIKNRRWDEFEREAKTEPSGMLADTVAELIKGFPDKADRKALKKVLYLLSQAGYEPSEEEVETVEETTAPSAPYTKGFMSSADAYGDSVVAYAIQSGDRIRWLVGHVGESRGITDAAESECSLEDAVEREKAMLQGAPRPILSAEVPAEYARYRLARGVEASKGGLPPVIAYWRARLRGTSEMAHPALALPRQETTDEERRSVVMTFPPCYFWRLELGAAAPILNRIGEAYERDPEAPEEARREMMDHILSQTRREAFTSETIGDHATRLLDLAYLLDLNGQSGSGLALSTYDDLVARGPESDYAKSLVDKTVMVLVETLRKKESPAPGATPTTLE